MLHEKTYGYCLNRCIFMMNRLVMNRLGGFVRDALEGAKCILASNYVIGLICTLVHVIHKGLTNKCLSIVVK